jgi:predicted small integral membrane protein
MWLFGEMIILREPYLMWAGRKERGLEQIQRGKLKSWLSETLKLK